MNKLVSWGSCFGRSGLFTFLAFTANAFAQGTADDGSADAIGRMAASYRGLNSVVLDAREAETVTRSSDDSQVTSLRSFKVRMDGSRSAVLQKLTFDARIDGRIAKFSQCTELVVTATHGVQIDSIGKTYDTGYRDAESVPLPNKGPDMNVAGSLDGKPPFPDHPPSAYMESARLVFGYIGFESHLADRLSGAATVSAKRRSELPDCIPVEKKGDLGTLTAWLDRRYGFLPRRIELRRNASDKMGAEGPRVAEFTTSPGKIYPMAKLVSTFLVIESVDLGEFNGTPVTRGYTSTEIYSYDDGQSLTFHTRFSVEDLRRPEERDFAPIIPIPDGTPVHVQSTPQIRYLWRQGRIEADPMAGAIGAFDGVRNSRGHGQSRARTRILVLGNVAIALALGVIWIARRRRR